MKDVKSINPKNIVSDHTSGRVMFLETMLTVNCFLGAGVDALRVVTVEIIFDLSRYIRTFLPFVLKKVALKTRKNATVFASNNMKTINHFFSQPRFLKSSIIHV